MEHELLTPLFREHIILPAVSCGIRACQLHAESVFIKT